MLTNGMNRPSAGVHPLFTTNPSLFSKNQHSSNHQPNINLECDEVLDFNRPHDDLICNEELSLKRENQPPQEQLFHRMNNVLQQYQ